MSQHQRGKPHGGQPKCADQRPPKESKPAAVPLPKEGRIASPRDGRGLPYPGDWPDPLGGETRGCF
jgi:hypothetical protein